MEDRTPDKGKAPDVREPEPTTQGAAPAPRVDPAQAPGPRANPEIDQARLELDREDLERTVGN
jgi:hypothetical protein